MRVFDLRVVVDDGIADHIVDDVYSAVRHAVGVVPLIAGGAGALLVADMENAVIGHDPTGSVDKALRSGESE